MNQSMELEMEKTIRLLQASMPKAKTKRTSLFPLMKIAVGEVNLGILMVLFVGVLICGLLAAKAFVTPMLVIFCTAPLPLLLLFHRYIICAHEATRELEETFLYSYPQMLAARTALISLYVAGTTLLLSLALHYVIGEAFIRLALCGCVSTLYLCTLILFLCDKFRSHDGLTGLITVIWTVFFFAGLQFSFDRVLQLCTTGLFGILTFGGVVLYAICLRKIKNRRNLYEFRLE